MKLFKLPIFIVIACAIAAFSTDAAEKKPKTSQGKTAKGTVKLVTADLKTAEHVYKKTPQAELKLHFHFPADWKTSDLRPAMLFFFGGGWRSGSVQQFQPQAEYFATRGLVTVRAEYRILNEHKTTPDIATEDAKSAMRWLRGHAAEFGIDPAKIIASGGSAGGHLAAVTALVEGFDAKSDDLGFSPKPAALVLFNPALNLAMIDREIPGADGRNVAKDISPTTYLKQRTVPTIIFFGDADALKAHGDEFLKLASGLGTRCEQWVAPGQPHGFFNREPWTSATAIQADRFLASLGYLKGAPTIQPADEKAKLKPQKP